MVTTLSNLDQSSDPPRLDGHAAQRAIFRRSNLRGRHVVSMNTALLSEKELFGLFELDDAGTVLYSRIEHNGKPHEARPDLSGRNFYEEVAPFLNVEEFKHRVKQFARGASPADKFNFDCLYEDSALPVRVLLARIRERINQDCTKSVLVYIRKAA